MSTYDEGGDEAEVWMGKKGREEAIEGVFSLSPRLIRPPPLRAAEGKGRMDT